MKEELKNVTETPENEYVEEMHDEFFDDDTESGPSLTLTPSTMVEEENDKKENLNLDLATFSSNTNRPNEKVETGTSNFDALFDSLYNDVAGANTLISELIERKKNINNNETLLTELKEKMEQEKSDFNKYVEGQKRALQLEKEQVNDYVRIQRIRIQNEETKFNADMDATRKEISLAEQSLDADKERLNSEKEQFEKYKQIEEEKLKNEREKLEQEKEHFEKERIVSEESIKAAQEELEKQKEQFEKYKELEEKKIELGNHNLSQSAARFKELVSQFNSGFSQLPAEETE